MHKILDKICLTAYLVSPSDIILFKNYLIKKDQFGNESKLVH